MIEVVTSYGVDDFPDADECIVGKDWNLYVRQGDRVIAIYNHWDSVVKK